ncbi:hypothetical protein M758_4G052600, partial [Ceratodon purpureus]
QVVQGPCPCPCPYMPRRRARRGEEKRGASSCHPSFLLRSCGVAFSFPGCKVASRWHSEAAGLAVPGASEEGSAHAPPGICASYARFFSRGRLLGAWDRMLPQLRC